MTNITQNLDLITQQINKTAKKNKIDPKNINLVAVSKNIEEEKIKEAINWGCKIFGENKVIEAKKKWSSLKREFPDIKLHLIGHLQSNKAREAILLFDVIETLDSEKLAASLSKEMKKQNKYPEIFIQINIGKEPQKNGIDPKEANKFINLAKNKYQLPITGLMCIPPLKEEPSLYFALLTKIAYENNLPNISMGMSNDYQIAIGLNANFIRVGTAIFKKR